MFLRVVVAAGAAEEADRLAHLLDAPGILVTPTKGATELQARLGSGDVELVVAAPPLSKSPSTAWVRVVKELPEAPRLVALTERDDPELRSRFMSAGFLAVLPVGTPDGILRESLGALVERCRAEAIQRYEARRDEARGALTDFVSQSPAMIALLRVVERVVLTDSSVLILGETGVGKDHLARTIHNESRRAAGPFVAVNCAALPESIVESELFGHEEGAFTGASRARKGFFELAHTGTLFLDEVAEIPVHVQPKLLRAIDERLVRRVGGERTVTVDVRIIAATNRDLSREIASGAFRRDLYYRLAVVSLSVPPLRERKDDIAELVESYLEHFGTTLGKGSQQLSPEALRVLTRYDWPGNVRELINVVERAVLLSRGVTIDVSDLPPQISEEGSPASAGEQAADLRSMPLRAARRRVTEMFERDYLSALLRETEGRVGETARRAGLSERGLFSLMRRHGIRKESFRNQPRG